MAETAGRHRGVRPRAGTESRVCSVSGHHCLLAWLECITLLAQVGAARMFAAGWKRSGAIWRGL
jgi:hypothetical protein